ncbi:uncharacterized protein FTJAE_1958 [Fusarium tjaetaba]|uniref:Uncharacterized protein n=1 Tax=Fusarium tjaetaba TaxID=1567544 RepID=A0A8H5W645_9HYPO|nr:uncharacterized protein FTJAE_1958 [Fusarium tjaetaba]KAF5646668.1 hypothetical protein FTJAE_1958 [Fusarium tjaetaba]
MPLPDTDEMIQARWGPRERLFHQWSLDNSKAILDTLKFEAKWNAFDLLLQKRWPSEKDRKDYYTWSREWNGRFMLRMSYKWSPKEFINTVLATDFLEAAGSMIHDLWWAMDTYNLSSIPIGYAKFGGVESYYAFEPAHRLLKPDCNESGPSILFKDILAINVKFDKARTLSVSSGSPETTGLSLSAPEIPSNLARPEKPYLRPRALTGPEQQPDPVELARNEIDPNHFVFAQLGLLYVYGGEYDHAKGCGVDVLWEGPWWRNDLRVVVRLDNKGKPGAVYVLYHPNSTIDVEDYDDEVELAPEAKDHVPGRLHPRCDEGFSLAKIANSLDELGHFDKEFRFLPITKTTCVIHRAQFLEHHEQGLTIVPALSLPVEVNK